MWDEIQDMPGEIFDMGDGSFMTEDDIEEGMKLLREIKDPCTIALEHDAQLLELLNANWHERRSTFSP